MCGIAGLISTSGPRAVADPGLRHRGPDGSGHLNVHLPMGSASLFHERLAIQDPSPAGAQPFVSADGSLILVFNGEIYNYPALRRECEVDGAVFRSGMDGEAILHLWVKHGVNTLSRLNGIYGIVVADTTTGEVVLARDPLGVKPLFVVQNGEDLWFASELSGLRRMGAPLGGPDTVALAQFLTFLWVPQPNTPYQKAVSLLPGGVLTWRAGSVSSSRVTYTALESRSGGSPEVEVGERVRSAVRRQLLSDVPVGLMASGGVDSSLVWWAGAESLERAFTIDWPTDFGGERLSEDAVAVRKLEQRFRNPVTYLSGADADPVVLPPSGDLFADPAYELTRLIAKSAREDGIKVLLAGQGADELFGGYRRHTVARAIERIRLGRSGRFAERALGFAATGGVGVEYAARLSRALAQSDGFAAYMQLCSYSTAEERAQSLDCMTSEVADEIVWAQHRAAFESQPAGASFLRKVLGVDQDVYLPGLGLAYMDRAGMEFGVEIRVPWLDLELVAWSRTLPDGKLVRRGRGKWLTKELASEVLGRQLAHRPKRGFAAPARVVYRGGHGLGQRGHRQGSYFARARQILDAHLAETA